MKRDAITVADAEAFLKEGLSVNEIATKCSRSTAWVRRQFELIGIPDLKNAPKRGALKQRACMCCRTPFLSEGSHNRLCVRCRNKSDDGHYRIVPA